MKSYMCELTENAEPTMRLIKVRIAKTIQSTYVRLLHNVGLKIYMPKTLC